MKTESEVKKGMKTIEVKVRKKNYKIYVDKLLFVLKILTDGAEIELTKENLLKMMKKFDLFDEVFLVEMSKK